MLKHTSKLVILGLIVVIGIPQVALASWWNPFSWSIFRTNPSKTEVFVNRVQEPENLQIATSSETIAPQVKIKETNSNSSLEAKKKEVEVRNATLKADEERLLQQQAEIIRKIEAVRQEELKQSELKKQAEEQEAIKALENSEKVDESPVISVPIKTTITVSEATCSWGGSGYRYTLPISIDGSWVSGKISTRSVRAQDGSIVRNGSLLYRSDLAKDGGFIFGTTNSLKEGATVTYEVRVYSEQPTYSRNTGPLFKASWLLDEKSGEFPLPACS